MRSSLFNLTCIIFEGKIIYLIIKILMFSIHVMISKDFYHMKYFAGKNQHQSSVNRDSLCNRAQGSNFVVGGSVG